MFEEGLYFMENHFELISIWRKNVFDEEKRQAWNEEFIRILPNISNKKCAALSCFVLLPKALTSPKM
jgi:hypothetical protein